MNGKYILYSAELHISVANAGIFLNMVRSPGYSINEMFYFKEK